MEQMSLFLLMPICKMTVTFWIPVTGGILQWAVSDYNGYLFCPTGLIIQLHTSNWKIACVQ